MEWEVSLIEWLQANCSSLGGVVKILAFLGSEVGLLLVVLAVMFCREKKAGQKLALIVVALNLWLSMIKSVVRRPRPYMEYPGRVKAQVLVNKDASALDTAAQGYSFPSMHSASVPAVYFTLAKEVKKRWLWIVAGVLTLLVGVSRSVAGMHYPTDVLAGWILGLAVLAVFSLLDRYVQKDWQYHMILLVSALPGIFYVRTSDYYTALGLLIGATAAIPFERKYVNFQDTRRIPAMVLRMLGAFLIYFAVNTILKLPFDEAFLAGTSLAAFLVRSARYAVIVFLIMGVYPMTFPAIERIGKTALPPAAAQVEIDNIMEGKLNTGDEEAANG